MSKPKVYYSQETTEEELQKLHELLNEHFELVPLGTQWHIDVEEVNTTNEGLRKRHIGVVGMVGDIGLSALSYELAKRAGENVLLITDVESSLKQIEEDKLKKAFELPKIDLTPYNDVLKAEKRAEGRKRNEQNKWRQKHYRKGR